jgi:hypothetical protein
LDVGNKINAATPTTAYASINLPHGNAPTSPVNGDMWTTTAATFVRINGTTIQMPDDSLVVHKAGTETITGVKSFTNNVDIYPGTFFVQSQVAYPYALTNISTGQARLKQADSASVAAELMLSGGYAYFDLKYDFDIYSTDGQINLNALTTFDAATTAKASLRVPHGTAPTTPVNGDVWTTTAGMYARINGTTVGPFGAAGATAWGSITGTLSSQTDLNTELGLKVALAGTQTITGAKTFTTNPTIQSTTGIPSLDIKSIQAAGYAPAFLNLARQGVASAPTPDTQGLGEIRFSGLTTTSAYFAGASINANSSVNTAAGAPTDLTFYTHNGTSLLERVRIDSNGAVTMLGSTTSGSNNAAVKIQDTTGTGAPLILYASSGTAATDIRWRFWDGVLDFFSNYNAPKLNFETYHSNQFDGSIYWTRGRGSIASPANLVVDDYLFDINLNGRWNGGESSAALINFLYSGDAPTSNDSAQQTTLAQVGLSMSMRHSDWGNNEMLRINSEYDWQIGPPSGGYFKNAWTDARAKFTLIGGDTVWAVRTITASIAADVLTVTVAPAGGNLIRRGMRLTSSTVGKIPPGVYITTFGTGTGGTGTYNLSTSVGTIASSTLLLSSRPMHNPTIRLRNVSDNAAGYLNGAIEFWNDSSAGDGAGTKSFIASEMRGASGNSDLIFGTASTVSNATEKLRLASDLLSGKNIDIDLEFVQTNSSGSDFNFKKARGSYDAKTAATTSDNLGIVGFKAYDGTNYVDGGYIQARLTAPASAGFAAAKMEFFLDNGSGGDYYLILDPSANAMTTTLAMITPASTTTRPSLRMPHGSAPTSPTNGDVWTTTAGMYARINGTTVGPFGTGGGGATWGSITGTLSSQTDLDTALGLKANIASPSLTGVPLSTTAAVDTNTTQIATTAYVIGQGGTATPTAASIGASVGTSLKWAHEDHGHGPVDVSALTPPPAGVRGSVLYMQSLTAINATTSAGTAGQAFISQGGGAGAPPLFADITVVGTITTGVWNAGAVTSSGAISGTALAGSLLSSATPLINGTAAAGNSTIPARDNHVHPTDTTRAALAGATFTGAVVLPAGTTTLTPIAFQAGSVLTTPVQHAHEWDGANLFITGDTTNGSGRMIVPAMQKRYLSAAGSAIAAGTDFFPTARPAMLAGKMYHFKYFLTFSKNTAGTVTFQLKNSAAVNFTFISATMQIFVQGAVMAALGNIEQAYAAGAATATFTASQSLANNANCVAVIEGWCVPVSNTRLSITPSAYGAGTISTVAGSNMIITDLGTAATNYGNFG